MSKLYTEELVYTEAEDGIILAGLAIQPNAHPPAPVMVVWIPGMTINFYHPSFISTGRELARIGIPFLIGNSRGHDLGANLWSKSEGGDGLQRRPGGALWERFEESPRDAAAWIDCASHLGYERVVLVGHSYGAPKVVCYQAQRQDPRLVGLVLASPSTRVASRKADMAALAEKMVSEGRGEELMPWGTIEGVVGTLSAQTYQSWGKIPDLFGRSDPEPALGQIRCPVLVCYGTNEGYDPAEDIELIRHSAAAAASVEVVLLEGANHGYDHHEQKVAAAIARWIASLGLA